MTDEIRDAIFQLKKLGWGDLDTDKNIVRNYVTGFFIRRYIKPGLVLSSMHVILDPFDKTVHTSLFNVRFTSKERKAIDAIIHSVHTLEDIDNFVRIWEEED